MKGSSLLLTHEAFPFDKKVSGMQDRKMIEDTAKIVSEAIKDKVWVNLIRNSFSKQIYDRNRSIFSFHPSSHRRSG
jgi:hypothetical protein